VDFIKKLKYNLIKINRYDHMYLLERPPIMGEIYPITFSIPEEKIVTASVIELIFQKTKIVSNLIPGDLSTYIYNTEEEYYAEYQKSYFAITIKKAGWDCMRHYEILGNYCMPYFIGLEDCPKNTLANFPKELLLEAKNIAENFEEQKYFSILDDVFNYTKNHLTTKNLANYIINHI
jgi:hypothetical protein